MLIAALFNFVFFFELFELVEDGFFVGVTEGVFVGDNVFGPPVISHHLVDY